MPKALDPKAPFDYVLKCDRELKDGHSYKTVWKLCGLRMKEETDVGNNLFGGYMDSQELSIKGGTHLRKILDAGLKGWENFNDVDENGKPDDVAAWTIVPVPSHDPEQRKVREEHLDKIAGPNRSELMNAITSAGKLTPEEGN